MKKVLSYCLLATLLCGCLVQEEDVTTPEPMLDAKVFTAIIDDSISGDTKTSLDANGNVLWKQGDQVSIFAGSTINEQYQVTDDSDGKTAATLEKVANSSFVAGSDIDNNVAFYPYSSTATIAKNGNTYVISGVSLPSIQNYAAHSFGNGAFPMMAVTEDKSDMNLKFKNVLGGLKLQLKGSARIASISVTGNNTEILHAEKSLCNHFCFCYGTLCGSMRILLHVRPLRTIRACGVHSYGDRNNVRRKIQNRR